MHVANLLSSCQTKVSEILSSSGSLETQKVFAATQMSSPSADKENSFQGRSN